MIHVYKLEPDDDVMDFTMEQFLLCMAEDKVWTFDKLSAYDFYQSDLINFKDNPRREFMVYDTDLGTLKYMWVEFGLRILKERDVLKVVTEKVEIK